MNVIFLGPPGTGKGTQAKPISAELGIVHISTGDIFRQLANEGDPLGVEARDKYWGAGGLVPDDITIKLVEKRFERDDWKNGFILDGFPRTIPQAEALENMVKVGYVIDIETPDDVIIKRLTSRRQCSNKECGKIYGIDIPPKVKGICDICGSSLYQRPDDTEEKVRRRLEVYREETKPLIGFYQTRGVLHIVDGTKKPEVLKEDILKILGKKA